MLGHTFRCQLLIYSCDSWLLSSFMLLCSYPLVICWSCYLVSYICSCSCYYVMHIVYMHELSLYTHTHQVAFWRPWICTSRYWTLVSIVQVFDKIVRLARSWTLSLFILVFSSRLSFCYFLILSLSHSVVIFFPLFTCYHCVRLYMYYCSDLL